MENSIYNTPTVGLFLLGKCMYKERLHEGKIALSYYAIENNVANPLTKALACQNFETFQNFNLTVLLRLISLSTLR